MGILTAIIEPRAQNTVTTSQELAEVLRRGGTATIAGKDVTPDSALRVIAVYACVKILAESIAQLPVHLYERVERGKRRVDDHPVARLLRVPNSWQTPFEFKEMQQAHIGLRGNAYCFKNRVRGQIRALDPIHPKRVLRVEQMPTGRIRYEIGDAEGGNLRTYTDQDVMQLRNITLDGVLGLSPVGLAREGIGMAAEAERLGSMLFENGAQVSGVLSTDQKLRSDDAKRIREAWSEAHSGNKKLGTAVLDGGWKWSQISLSAEDAQFLQTRKFQVTEIARLYRVPPHMIADLDRATFSNIEEQSLEFVKYTLLPWLRRWEGTLNRHLLSPDERDNMFIEFNVEGLLRGDSEGRGNFYAQMVQNKLMTRNEVRQRENLNTVEGGDEFENPAITPGASENDDDGK